MWTNTRTLGEIGPPGAERGPFTTVHVVTHRALTSGLSARPNNYTKQYTKPMDLGAVRAYGAGMESTISSGALRRRAGTCLARVSRGDSFIVLRHGSPVAVLRPPAPGDEARARTATFLWRNLRDLMAVARREPVLITW